jgi:hypothetical protein
MSVYYFRRYGTLWCDKHPMALYAGGKRLSPEATPVLWWPVNWLVLLIALPRAMLAARAKGGADGQ